MSVIFILIPLSILIAACFLAAFIWAVRSGQYEDTTTPSMRVLLEDAPTRASSGNQAPGSTPPGSPAPVGLTPGSTGGYSPSSPPGLSRLASNNFSDLNH